MFLTDGKGKKREGRREGHLLQNILTNKKAKGE